MNSDADKLANQAMDAAELDAELDEENVLFTDNDA
jgi:hypothetical protein